MGHVQCPSCRHEFQLPKLGVDGLLKNTTLRNIVDRYRESKSNTAASKAAHKAAHKAVPSQMCDKEPYYDAVETYPDCDDYCELCTFDQMEGALAGLTLTDASAVTPKDLTPTVHPQEKVGKHGYHRVGVVTAVPDTSQQNQTKAQPDIYSILWSLDRNRVWQGIDYKLDIHGDIGLGDRLFRFVDRDNLEEIPTYRAFLRLLDNYNIDQPEYVTKKEENNARAFLNCCLDTEVMQEAHSFLAKKGCVPKSRQGFKGVLYDMWFTPYSRTHRDRVQRFSTGFEHTFLGETRCRHMIGFHNWLRFYEEERQGCIQVNDCKRHYCEDRQILTVDFDWHDGNHTSDSFFVGTSPEFELALYTVCFLAGDGAETRVVLGGETVTIATLKLGGYLGSCYPILREQSQPGTEYHTKDNSSDNPLVAEGLGFLQYLKNEKFGPELPKGTLKRIYERDYTWSYGRRPRTPFSLVLRTLMTNGKVATYWTYHGMEMVTFLK
ncbi:ENDOU [Branchiostoma lanceolatum]|uniref:Uridylate-specific endoribonuclease n=1 Tax=Branchiostoma lanceolatum TaxID=7740 RepID=A0A8K0ERK2_BRALA|nr:ENDOU [Branchiostoma lanceolatum]